MGMGVNIPWVGGGGVDIPMVYRPPLPMVYRPPYQWYINPLPYTIIDF